MFLNHEYDNIECHCVSSYCTWEDITMDEKFGFILLGLLVVVIIAGLCIFCIYSTKKQKALHKQHEEQKKADNKFFIDSGYMISKQIKNLLIDDVHKKWMVTGSNKIFDYDNIVSVRIIEDGRQIEVGVLSAQATIKTMSVVVETNDALNALITIPIVEMKGSLGLEVSSFDYSECKKTAMEQEAFFNAVISQRESSK